MQVISVIKRIHGDAFAPVNNVNVLIDNQKEHMLSWKEN